MVTRTVPAALSMVALAATTVLAGVEPRTGVVDSVHDMTKYGTLGGTDPEQNHARVCSYCHTPHHTIVQGNDYLPLWSHTVTGGSFTPYKSATLDAVIDADTMLEGPSKLCMSCHDGTIAVDTHYGYTGTKALIEDDGLFETPSVGRNGFTNNDHPIGFVYDGTHDTAGVAIGPITGDADLASRLPGKDPAVRNSTATYLGSTLKISDRLYPSPRLGGKKIMTCATCHDVHNKVNQDETGAMNYLLLAPINGSKLCLSCHIK